MVIILNGTARKIYKLQVLQKSFVLSFPLVIL